MSFKLNNQMLRTMKHLLIDNDNLEKFHGLCPFCKSIIEFVEVHTAPQIIGNGFTVSELNEGGVMIGKCNNYECRDYFKLEIINPELSDFNSGATKMDYYIHTDDDKEKLSNYEFLRYMTEIIEKNTILKNKNSNYDYYNHPLYICNTCENNLEIISFNDLRNKWGRISKGYWNYTNWALGKARGEPPSNIVINLPIICSCGEKHIAKFESKYHEHTDFDRHSFSLIDVYGSKPLNSHITAVHSKTTIMNWLYKLIARWNFIFDKIYIISPFISYLHAENSKTYDTWLNLIPRIDNTKTDILTRGGQVKPFKKAFDDLNEKSYETMEMFGMGSELVNSIKTNKNFHAKIYCGVSNDICEIMNGSSNLVEGPTLEVINFISHLDYRTTYEKYLKPLNLEYLSEELILKQSKEYSLFFDEESDFIPIYFYKKDYIDYVMNNIIPEPLVI